MSGQFHEVGVVTDAQLCPHNDVCCADVMPEVELVSLVSEQLPRYKLRADTMTEFAGYSHRDFSQCSTAGGGTSTGVSSSRPGIGGGMEEEEEDLDLTAEQIENLLDYFILCGLRVSQMTKAYDDIEAVTQLLDEKERDLELAATIGKNLLEKNKKLEEQVEQLEENVRTSTEEVRQLRHELSLKDDLLRIYAADVEDAVCEEPSTDSLSFSSSTNSSFNLSRVNVEQLQRKVQELQEENIELRTEHQTIAVTAQRFEEKEQNLMKDCLMQLTEANSHIRTISEDLSKKTDKCMQQQEDVTFLLAKNIDLDGRVKQLVSENEFIALRFKESEQNRALLTAQLSELRDRYDECLTLLAEAQTESRDLRKRHRRRAPQSFISSPSSLGGDLASELALASKSSQRPRPDILEVESEPEEVESVRVMGAVRHMRNRSLEGSLASDTSAALRTAEVFSCSSGWDAESAKLRCSMTTSGIGIPGSASFSWSGSDDIEASRGAIVHNWLSGAPEKLQIVKPIEGSLTLRQWQHLATPSLSRALFESVPSGVQVRGGKKIQPRVEEEEEEEEEQHALSDVEEDDAPGVEKVLGTPSAPPTEPPSEPPPGADTSVTSPFSSGSSCFSNPEHCARMARHNISNMSPGLARILCERGIHSQAAVAALSDHSSNSSTGDEGEEPPVPPLYHAQLLESINRVGHRLWTALNPTAAASPRGLMTQRSSSSSSTVVSTSTISGLNCCLSPTQTTPTGPTTTSASQKGVLRRTDR